MSEQIWLGTLCAQCGYDVPVDEDGCCATCGADAIGEGADEAIGYRAECYQLRDTLRHVDALLTQDLGGWYDGAPEGDTLATVRDLLRGVKR